MDHSHVLTLLIDLLIIFGIAGLIVPIFQRFRISPVLCYLLCGLLIGSIHRGLVPNLGGVIVESHIDDVSIVQALGELGVIALMFMIGLELSLKRLKEIKHYVLGLGSLQILITGLAIGAAALAFHNSVEVVILVAASFALSSTAIVMQLLEEKRMIGKPVGILAFSILLMQDLAVVPMLVLISVISGGEENIALALLEAAGLAVVAIVGMFVLGRLALRPLFQSLSVAQNPEWLLSFSLFLVVFASVETQISGLSAALGAFMAGLLIAETSFRHQVEVAIAPIKGILMGIFFLSVGMMIDVAAVMQYPGWLAASVVGLMVIKAAVLFPICLAFKVPKDRAAEVAIMMAEVGEFAFVILSLAFGAGLVPKDDYQFFLLVTALSMMLVPLNFQLAPRVGHWLRAKKLPNSEDAGPVAEGQVVIAGFGRMGADLVKKLEDCGQPYSVIEQDAEQVQDAVRQKLNVHYGDACQMDLLRKMGAEKAAAIIITIDQPRQARAILKAVRKEWPGVPVIMRAYHQKEVDELYEDGATYVVAEMKEATEKLGKAMFDALEESSLTS
jgi:CPA2 family monovalent cation:H+ antiporter-2